MDYKDVKRGIKQVEYDRVKLNTKIFFSIIAGIIAGVIARKFGLDTFLSCFIGITVLFMLGIKAQRTYWELDKKNGK